jgi:hypothetical protein
MKSERSLHQLFFDLFFEGSGKFAIPVDNVKNCYVEVPYNEGNWVPLQDDSMFEFGSVSHRGIGKSHQCVGSPSGVYPNRGSHPVLMLNIQMSGSP